MKDECATRKEHGFCCCGMGDPNDINFSPHDTPNAGRVVAFTNRQGEKVIISKMDDGYLKNAVSYFRRAAQQFSHITLRYYILSPGPSGEMAQDMFDRELEARGEEERKMWALVVALEAEMRKRKITNSSIHA